MKKVLLKVLGISYSQSQSGTYALLLGEANGERRIPIIIGSYEAQAIAIQLEGMKMPRPLTHDLFFNFAVGYNITLEEVFIFRLDEGFFYSKLICDNDVRREEFDARTSDAVALALRFGCPIYTTTDIMERAGMIVTPDKAGKPFRPENSLGSKKLNDLENLLQEAIKNEDYEQASKIRDEIKRRQGS